MTRGHRSGNLDVMGPHLRYHARDDCPRIRGEIRTLDAPADLEEKFTCECLYDELLKEIAVVYEEAYEDAYRTAKGAAHDFDPGGNAKH